MTKTKYALVALITCAAGFHYWELRQNLFVANWKNSIHESEHRILRDELSEVRAKPTFEMGIVYSTLRSQADAGFQDGMVTAFKSMDPQFDYVRLYHMVCESLSANQAVADKMNKQKEIDAYHQGTIDASGGIFTPASPVSEK